MKLATLQRAFQAHVLAQRSTIDREVACIDSDAEAAERLAIYAHAYPARLTGALATVYPQVQRALGPESFAVWTDRFSRDMPSRRRSIRDYGDALPAYLAAAFKGVKAQGLQELARWEWSLAAAFDAPDDEACRIDLGAIQPEAWPTLRFAFTSSLRRIDLTTNALHWRLATPPARWRRLSRPATYAIWRGGLDVYFRSLDAAEAVALDAALRGATFGEVCDCVLAAAPETDDAFAASALRAATLLQNWIHTRWIVRVQS